MQAVRFICAAALHIGTTSPPPYQTFSNTFLILVSNLPRSCRWQRSMIQNMILCSVLSSSIWRDSATLNYKSLAHELVGNWKSWSRRNLDTKISTLDPLKADFCRSFRACIRLRLNKYSIEQIKLRSRNFRACIAKRSNSQKNCTCDFFWLPPSSLSWALKSEVQKKLRAEAIPPTLFFNNRLTVVLSKKKKDFSKILHFIASLLLCSAQDCSSLFTHQSEETREPLLTIFFTFFLPWKLRAAMMVTDRKP